MNELIPNMASEEYHAFPAFSHSLAVEAERSWEHAIHKFSGDESTSAMNFGSAFHDRVLLPEYFKEHWAVKGGCCGITQKEEPCKKGGQVRVDGLWFCNTHAPLPPHEDIETVTAGEIDLIETMYNKIQEHSKARSFLGYLDSGKQYKNSHYEVSLFWEDPLTGIQCKARVDLISGISPVLVDLKTCQCDRDWETS